MGTIRNAENRLETFQNDIFPRGLDLGACKYHQDGGVYTIQEGVTIRPGSLVARTPVTAGVLASPGLVIPVTTAGEAANVFGIAKWGTEAIGSSVRVDEVYPGFPGGTGTTINLRNANLVDTGGTGEFVNVHTAANFGGTKYTVAATNFTVNAVNGVLTNGATPVPANVPLFISYMWNLTQAQLRFNGVKFHSNTSDDVAFSSANRLAVITDWSIIFTTEFDDTLDYDTQGTASNLYCDVDGRFTNTALAANRYVGKVYQLPRSGYPYLGVIANPGPTLV